MDIDLKIRLLAGDSIYVDDKISFIPQIKLKEIKDIGYTKYCQYLNFFIMNISDIFKNIDLSEIDTIDGEVKLNLFDYIVLSNDNSLLNIFIESINFFCKTNAKYFDNVIFLDSKDRFLYRENYELLCKMIKIMNYIIKPDELNKPVVEESEATKRLKKRKQEIEEKRNKNKKNNNELDIADVIGLVSTKNNNLNILNIWDLTVYQLYDLFNNLNLISSNDIHNNASAQAITQGAKDIEFKNWFEKQNN